VTQHHDPVHPDSAHLTVELVADLATGVLDDESAAHARQHLDHCDQCRETAARLEQVSAALGSLPPVTVPPAVAQRLDDALASAGSPAEAPRVVSMPDTVVPLDAHRRRAGWSTRLVTIAASAAGVLLVSAVGISLLNNGSSGGSTVAGTSADGGTAASAPELALDGYVAGRSGQSYDEKRLDQQVNTLLVANQSEITSSPSPDPADSPGTTPEPVVTATVSGAPMVFGAAVVDPVALRACVVDYLGVPDAAPLAADVGTYNGQPAAILVMPTEGKPDQADVYVVDPDCSGPDATTIYWLRVTLPAQLRQ
jgi:hypothetical protein